MANRFSLRPEAPQLILNFMLAAITSILTVRLFLHLTNNFQLTFGHYHIAHVLWGGLIMTLAFILIFLFSSPIIFRLSATIAGFGWGWYIDEIGKYVTRDNNYWYQPAVIYIYVSFILLYLLYHFTQTRFPPRPPKSYLWNSLSKKATQFKPLFIALFFYSLYYAVDKLIDLRSQFIIHPVSHMTYLKLVVDFISSLLIISGWFFYLSRRRLTGLNLFRLSLLTNIFLGAVVKFYFEQFNAVFSLAVNILVLTYLNAYKTGKVPPSLLQ
jgi:hypothetical protein